MKVDKEDSWSKRESVLDDFATDDWILQRWGSSLLHLDKFDNVIMLERFDGVRSGFEST